jgi:hypothetical protein
MDKTTDIEIRELDRRRNGEINVRLMWNSRTDTTFVAVEDERSGESLEFAVAASEALDAFRHPYAYAARRRSPSHVLIS